MNIPAFGLGTFRLKDRVVIDSVSTALELGYRCIDTAQIYGNEAEVGKAISDSGIPRDELFITTKIWVDNLSRDMLADSLKDSLDRLRTDHVDLTLIHWPSRTVPAAESLMALARAQSDGLTRAFGVSNFTTAQMQEAIHAVGAAQIATNQVELHPYLQNHKVVAFAKQHGIHITSYMTLAYGKVLKDPLLEAIAAHHGATPAQVALAWAMHQGHAVIPSSTRRENLESNLRSIDLQLTEEDMARIAALDRGERLTSPASIAPDWD